MDALLNPQSIIKKREIKEVEGKKKGRKESERVRNSLD